MKTFKSFLTENYKNLFSVEDKKKYVDEAWDQLQKAYAKIGGIKGAGFENKESFTTIPFWKLNIVNNKLVSAAYYKDNNGRKLVAISCDGSAIGKKTLGDMLKNDFQRQNAYAELSGPLLNFLVKQIGYDKIKELAIPFDRLGKLFKKELTTPPKDDDEVQAHPTLKDYFYQRKLGSELYTKIALGTTGKKIEFYQK